MSIDFNNLSPEDKFVYEEMFNWNVYQVEPSEIQGKVVLDIGGHLGMFTMSCMQHKPGLVIAVEANPNNYLEYLKNTIEYLNVKPINAACSYRSGDIVTISNEGCLSQTGKGTITVSTVSLEYLINLTTYPEIVLKIDIEGAEHDIFTRTPVHVFKRIKTIYMEAHDEKVSGEGKTISDLDKFIQNLGYTKVWHGLFHTDMPDGTRVMNKDIAILKYERIS